MWLLGTGPTWTIIWYWDGLGGGGEEAHGLPMQSALLPPPAPPLQPCIGARQAIFRSKYPDPQSPPARAGEAGLDIWQDFGGHLCQGNCAPGGVPAERPATRPTDLFMPQHGSEETVSGVRQHYRFPPCVWPPPCKRDMGLDARRDR